MKFLLKYRLMLGIALLFGLWACNRTVKRNEHFTEEDTLVERGKGVEILYSDSAVVRVRIRAKTLLSFTDRDNPRQEFPDGVLVDFLNAQQQITSTLWAKHGVREQVKGVVTLRDSVVLHTANQEKLETEELIWEEKSDRAHTDKFIKVTKPGEVMYGFGLEANQDFSYWKILVPKGRIKTEQIDKALDE